MIKINIIFVLIALCFALFSCDSPGKKESKTVVQESKTLVPEEEKVEPFEIADGRVGNLKIDTNVLELPKLFPNCNVEKKVEYPEPDEIRVEYYNVICSEGMSIRAERGMSWNIWKIEVFDSRYKTSEGIGVGTTVGEIKKHYKSFEIRELAESSQKIILISPPAATLILSTDKEKVLDSDKVESIILFKKER